MSENINRRDFLKKSVKAVIIGTAALTAFDVTRLLASVPKEFSVPENNIPKVINISDYPELTSVGGYANITETLFVLRTSQSKFLALNLTCTHKKCTVEFDGNSFECPCHGSEYSKTGKVTNGPATKNLKNYKTTYDSDEGTLTINM